MKKYYVLYLVLCLFFSTVFSLNLFAQELATDGYPVPRVVDNGQFVVGWVYADLTTESIIRNYKQVQIEAEHRGWKLVQGGGIMDDEHRNVMQNFIAQDVDAIIVGNMSTLPLKDLYIKARNKGIGVYNVDTQLQPGAVANVTQPNGLAALKLFYKVCEDMLWEARIAIITVPHVQVNVERTEPIKGIIKVYPGLELVGEEFIAGDMPARQQAFNYANTWIQKFGDDLDIIIGSWDGAAVGAANAIRQAGYDSSEIFSTGIDGGNETWTFIRQGTPFKYNFAQPFELYQHDTFELIEQIQVRGLQPGDDGCIISRYGETIYREGHVVTQSNVPDSGVSVHAAFDFYGGDPDDPDAWYNWQDAGGPYLIGTEIAQ